MYAVLSKISFRKRIEQVQRKATLKNIFTNVGEYCRNYFRLQFARFLINKKISR
jgi:hypothetical protein